MDVDCPPHALTAACFFFLRFRKGGFVKMAVVYPFSLFPLFLHIHFQATDTESCPLGPGPDALDDDPTMGFGAPVKVWSRIPLPDRPCVCLHPNT